MAVCSDTYMAVANENQILKDRNEALEKAARKVVDKALRHSHLDGPVEDAIDALAALLQETNHE